MTRTEEHNKSKDVIKGNLDRFNLGLVFNELALEVSAVGVAPFAGDELPIGLLPQRLRRYLTCTWISVGTS